MFKAAKWVLDGRDPRDLVHQASNVALHADRAGQILCCTQAMAAWAVVGGKVHGPMVVAGYSVGELGRMGYRGFIELSGSLGTRGSSCGGDGRSRVAAIRLSGHPRSQAKCTGRDLQGAWGLYRHRQRCRPDVGRRHKRLSRCRNP